MWKIIRKETYYFRSLIMGMGICLFLTFRMEWLGCWDLRKWGRLGLLFSWLLNRLKFWSFKFKGGRFRRILWRDMSLEFCWCFWNGFLRFGFFFARLIRMEIGGLAISSLERMWGLWDRMECSSLRILRVIYWI